MNRLEQTYNSSNQRLSTPGRRGIALLLALAALMTMMILVTTIVRLTSNAAIIDHRRSCEREAAAIVQVLTEQLPRTLPSLAPPPSADPWIKVIDEKNEELGVRVRGIDLSGRLHVKHLDRLARFGLPDSLQNIQWDDSDRVGPVLLEELLADERVEVPIFPEPLEPLDGEEDLLALGEDSEEPDDTEGEDEFEEAPPEMEIELVTLRTVVCEWLTTVGPGYFNVNTAPLPLLREALIEADATASQECLTLREKGESVPTQIVNRLNGPEEDPADEQVEDEDRLLFVNESQALGLLVEIQHGPLTHRWWMTMERDRRGWQMVERRRIHP